MVIRNSVITFFVCMLLGLPIVTAIPVESDLSVAEIPSELLSRKWKKYDLANLISPESVLRKFKKKRELILVDVREMDDFRRFKIPGSINEALFSVNSGATTTYRGWFYQFQGPIRQKKKDSSKVAVVCKNL